MMIEDHDDNFVVIDDADDCLYIMVSFHLHYFQFWPKFQYSDMKLYFLARKLVFSELLHAIVKVATCICQSCFIYLSELLC